MVGRPPLRIGEHGRISRTHLGGGVWRAECRFRDGDGVTRKVRRVGPADEHDRKGKLAEDALIEALAGRRAPDANAISLDTLVMALVDQHIDRLTDDDHAVRTIDTYIYDAGKLAKFIAGVRVGEATAARLDAALRSMHKAHGPTMARRARTLLRGALQLAVLNDVLGTNPVRDVSLIKSKTKPKGAEALTADQLRELLGTLRGSESCRRRDLIDPVILLIATGLRRSELLGLRWTPDFDAAAGTITVSGKVIRQHGKGLVRIDETKTEAGRRTIPLPSFAVTTLIERRQRPFIGEQSVIFASTTGTLRDPDNFAKQWRQARDELGVPDVTSHSFRKTLATLIDDAGLSARIGADQLGHAQVSMTQDRYMARGRVHHQVAELLEQTVGDDTGTLNAH